MEYQTVERDFVMRSLELIRQYDEIVRPVTSTNQQFEITLLLNCLLGLIIVPFEHSKRTQNNAKFPIVCGNDGASIDNLDPSWGLDKLQITKFELDGKTVDRPDVTVGKIVAMFRHSMSHSRFGDGFSKRRAKGLSVHYTTASSNPQESEIREVTLANKYGKEVKFQATIPVDSIKAFATRVALGFLQRLQSATP